MNLEVPKHSGTLQDFARSPAAVRERSPRSSPEGTAGRVRILLLVLANQITARRFLSGINQCINYLVRSLWTKWRRKWSWENFREVSDWKSKRFRAGCVRNVSRQPRRVPNSTSRIGKVLDFQSAPIFFDIVMPSFEQKIFLTKWRIIISNF